MICSLSARTSNVDIEDLSSGMTCLRFQDPQANWKKSSQGSAPRSIALNRYEAKDKIRIKFRFKLKINFKFHFKFKNTILVKV